MLNKIGAAFAGLALAVAALAGTTAASAAPAAPARSCSVVNSNLIQEGHGGWYRAKILHSCKGVGVQAKVQCRTIKNTNYDGYGPVVYATGRTTKAKCGTTLVIKEAWVVVAKKAHEVWPKNTTAKTVRTLPLSKRLVLTSAKRSVASAMFLTNDPQISAHANGVGAQYTTTLEGNETNVTRVAEGTACGGLTVYSFHDASGVHWMRVPAGANTLNLSTIHDARAEFIGHPAAHSGMTYNFFGNGCGDSAVIENADATGQGMFVRDLPNGAFDNYTIR